jgi:adenosylcobinamide-GDP ribazoletransferase
MGADAPAARHRTTGAAAFGLVGALVGAAGAAPLLVLGERAPLAAGVLAAGALALVSGALHLDGLADTVDALAAPSAEAADRARKDPRVGPAGAAAIVVVVVADAALLASIVELRGAVTAALACVVAASGSRAIAPVAAWLAGRGQPRPTVRSGLGAWFVARAAAPAATTAWITALVIAVVAGSFARTQAPAAALVTGTLLAIGVSIWLRDVRGGLDGDAFGFLIEVAFSAMLFIVVLTL